MRQATYHEKIARVDYVVDGLLVAVHFDDIVFDYEERVENVIDFRDL